MLPSTGTHIKFDAVMLPFGSASLLWLIPHSTLNSWQLAWLPSNSQIRKMAPRDRLCTLTQHIQPPAPSDWLPDAFITSQPFFGQHNANFSSPHVIRELACAHLGYKNKCQSGCKCHRAPLPWMLTSIGWLTFATFWGNHGTQP